MSTKVFKHWNGTNIIMPKIIVAQHVCLQFYIFFLHWPERSQILIHHVHKYWNLLSSHWIHSNMCNSLKIAEDMTPLFLMLATAPLPILIHCHSKVWSQVSVVLTYIVFFMSLFTWCSSIQPWWLLMLFLHYLFQTNLKHKAHFFQENTVRVE